jgi:hypothetical protein
MKLFSLLIAKCNVSIREFRIDAMAVLMAVLMTHFDIKMWLLNPFNSD